MFRIFIPIAALLLWGHRGTAEEYFVSSAVTCKVLKADFLERLDQKISTAPTKRRRFKISMAGFLSEVKKAQKIQTKGFDPFRIGDLEEFPELIRVDGRPPDQVKRDGGLLPNPDAPKNTSIAAHVESGGSSYYVSFSREHNVNVLLNPYFFPKMPARLVYKGKVSDRVTPDQWGAMTRKEWPISTPLEELPAEGVFEIYEYRVRNVLGAPVNGGRFGTEREVVARGVTVADGSEWRVITIRSKLVWQRIEEEGRVYYHLAEFGPNFPTQPGYQTFAPDPSAIEYSPWKPI